MSKLKQYQIDANEQFYKNIIEYLMENGVYVWKDKPHIPFKKQNGKLVTNKEGMDEIGELVTVDFLLDNFKLED